MLKTKEYCDIINKVFYCESCNIMLADLDSDSQK